MRRGRSCAGSSSERPVISLGGSIPSSANTVGATSARRAGGRDPDAAGRDDQRHPVERVRGVRPLVGLEHVLGVSVVGGDHAHAPGRVHRLNHPLKATVDGLDPADRGGDHSGVADHVGVGEVDDREPRPVLGERLPERAGDLPRAHLRLVVVGRDVALGGYERTPLPGVRPLAAAVEEVRDVRVLLGLGHMQLALAGGFDHRPERGRGAALNATG